MTNITVRWAGPSDATAGSTYTIERTLNGSDWTVLAAAQAASSPYVSPMDTLASTASFGDTSLVLTDASDFPISGYGWLEDALVQWSGKSSNTLTGVVWHSGYGSYVAGTVIYHAHESYADTNVTITLGAALYRITHVNSAGTASAPAYLWYYYPPVPSSSDHCVVIVNVMADLAVEIRANVAVDAYLDGFDYLAHSGAYLDPGEASALRALTNSMGLAFLQLYRSSARLNNQSYTVAIDADSDNTDEFTVSTVPDRDWALLSDVKD